MNFIVNRAASIGSGRYKVSFCNSNEEILFISSKNMWEEKDSNEVEVTAILEASQIYSYASYNHLIVENNSPKVIPWVSSMTEGSWKVSVPL